MKSKIKTIVGTKMKKDLTDFEKTTIIEYKNRFTKWQDKQINLLNICINLNFTIVIAISGFIISNYDKALFKNHLILGNISLTKSSLFLLATSATIGVFALISRLNDFRITKDIIKLRRRKFEIENDIKHETSEIMSIDAIKNKIDNAVLWTSLLGNLTWLLFYLQIILLMTTIWIIIIST